MTTAREFCSQTVYVVHRTNTLVEVARRMREHHVGALVVVEERGRLRMPVGVLTDRDLVVSVLAKDAEHLQSLRVGDVITDAAITVRDEASLEEVLRAMQSHGVRRMPVVDREGGLVGVVTFDDVLRHLAGQLADLSRALTHERQHEEARHP